MRENTAVLSDNELTVEAPTAAEALERIAVQLGPDATIVSAERVARGGIGGFFARELVRVTAVRPQRDDPIEPVKAPSEPAPAPSEPAPAPSEPAPAPSAPAHNAFALALDRYLTDGRDAPAEAPELHLGPFPTSTQAPEPPAVVAAEPELFTELKLAEVARVLREQRPNATPKSRQPRKTVRWMVDDLVAAGVPFEIIEETVARRPRGDLGWMTAIGRAVAPLCKPLPLEPALVIGPNAAKLAPVLHSRCIRDPEKAPAGRTVCLTVPPRAIDRQWLAPAAAHRWIHAVAGGNGWWRHMLTLDAAAISWTEDADLLPVLRLAVGRGITLGYGPSGGRPVRAHPISVALSIRRLVTKEQ